MRTFTHYVLWQIGLADPQTQTTAAERDALARYAAGRHRVVEIGVWHGVTSARLLAAMADDGTFVAVDPYVPGRLGVSLPFRVARRTVAPVDRGRVRWMRESGVEAALRLTREGLTPVDFIFVDGDHSYQGLRADWAAWAPLVRPGGIIALHDSRESAGRSAGTTGSVRFTAEVIVLDPRFCTVESIDSLTVLQRVPDAMTSHAGATNGPVAC